MKIQLTKNNREQGTILLIALLISAIMGITLASYLIMIQTQNRTTMRSQIWNSSIALTEAGVEDGLQLLNRYTSTFDQLTNWTSTAVSDNWSTVAANVYYVRRYIGENYYDVYITNSGATPTIHSSGTAVWHYQYASASAPQSMFATAGVDQPAPAVMNRNVDVKTKIDSLINVAMAAIQTIDFNGKNIQTDSFDSADPAFSANGLYPVGDASRTKATGDVVTDGTIINTLSVGNAKIKGHVKTGPNGSISIGPNGSVGDRAWVEGGTTGIEPSYSANDMNVVFPDVVLPSTTWMPANNGGGSGQVNGKSYAYIISTSGDYSIPGLSGSIYVATNVVARIKCTGTVNVTGNDQIYIDSGASVKFYMTAASFSLAGNGVINKNGNASSFYYFGLPSNSTVAFAGNANFVGVVYAPEGAFSLGGGGSNTYDFIGASVSKTVKMNGHFNFHYDENLRRNNMGRGYIPTNWKES